MKFYYKKFLILLLPVIFLWSGINFNRAKYANDPNYIYLMNALCICNGKSVGNTDNPGTTVMQISAATMAVMHLFSNPENESLTNHVIRNPEKFVEGARIVFVILNSLVLFLLGWVAIKKSASVWLAILLQISTFVSSNTLDHVWTKLSPEPLLFFVTGVYVLILLYYYFEKDKNKWKYVLLFSLVAGAGLGTKATFLPLIILPLIVLPTFQKKIGYLVGIVPAFVLFTIPAVPEYKHMFFWFRDLIRHKGIYGHGGNGFIDIKTYFPNLINILENNLLITLVLGLGIVALGTSYLLKRKSETNNDRRFLVGLIATIIFGILLVAKHHKEHYLLPVLLLSGITTYFMLKLIEDIFDSKILHFLLLPAVVTLLICIVTIYQPVKMHNISQKYKSSNEEITSTNLLMDRDYAAYVRINYYTFSLNKFTALKFGDDYAKVKILPYLMKMYPNTYFYDFPGNHFYNWNREIQLKDIVRLYGNKILLVNGPNDHSTVEKIREAGFPLNKIYSGRVQNLYVLDTLNYVTSGRIEKERIGN